MSYPATIQYLESFINYEKIPAYPYKESLKLERIKDFLQAIGNPQENLKCIHIAGSKGKGSTCAFVSHILRQAGYSIGLYTSPHLTDFRERIRILSPRNRNPQLRDDFEGMIAKEELTELVNKLKPSIEEYNEKSKYGPLSFFEVYTSLAFVYFKEKKVDFTVLETGLGGRLDATNVANSLVCAITPISYEHTQKLGNTLREIAAEKSGIIKNSQSIVISAYQENEAIEVIRNRCREIGARLFEVGKDIKYKKKGEKFSIKGILGEYNDLKINLAGEHQFVNASVAVGVIEGLNSFGLRAGADSVRNGLYNTAWPGRCEVVSCNPLVVLDGAQNTASAQVLKKTIKESFKYERLILVLGISKDKDIKGICEELHDLADTVILTKSDNPRATEPEILAEYFKDKTKQVTNNVKEASRIAHKTAKKEDLILVTGSLFVVGETRELLQKHA